jgi:hypothetical protein
MMVLLRQNDARGGGLQGGASDPPCVRRRQAPDHRMAAESTSRAQVE